MLPCPAVVAGAVFLLLSCAGWAAESKSGSNALPAVASVPATNALPDFRVRLGFRLELVAREPAVISPVAMAFDENNRLFVVERCNDSSAPGTNAHSSRIRLLEDTEGNGEFHRSTIYADNLPWASAVACYSGGVFVATSPDILFLKDTKTNGIADVRQAIFTGFTGTNQLGERALVSSFTWGLDNCIHAASGGVSAFAPGSSAPGADLVSLTGADFCFDPRALTLWAETGPAQSGLCFDDWGRKFTCDPMRPLRSSRYERRYLARNPFFAPPPQMIEVVGPATAIFRLISVPRAVAPHEGAQETNELARTVAQASTVLVATWLTNARSCVIYRGNAFPSNYFGNAFIADPSAQVIHRAVLREAELEVSAARAPEERNTEFVLSTDPAFRPTQIINGPDGALYVADMQDGHERGRIYRIVPAAFKRPKPARLGGATGYGLVAMLSHPNGWYRDTAARLLSERRDPAAMPLLANMLSGSRSPLTRLQTLQVLDGLGALTQAQVLAALQDQDERVREHAVELAERQVRGGEFPFALWNQLRQMAIDPSLRVRHQLALTLGELRGPESARVLAGLFSRASGNPWMQTAILSSLAEGAGDVFVNQANDPRVRGDAAGWEFLRRLVTLIGVKRQPAEAGQVLGFIDQTQLDPRQALPLIYILGEGLRQAGSSLAQIDTQNRGQRYYSLASEAVISGLSTEPIRIAAMRLIGVGPYTIANSGDLLLLPLGSGQPESVQSAAIAALGHFDDSRIVPVLIQRWRVLTPRLRREAASALLARAGRVGAVLTALEAGQIDRTDLSPMQVNFLRTHRDPAISQRAVKLFGSGPRQHPDLVRRFQPALSLKGAADRGRGSFDARCAACHQRGGTTQSIGPDLTGVRIYGKERVLRGILEPNADVRRDYLTYVLETGGGENVIGLLRADNPTTVCLQPSSGRPVVWPRDNIQYLQAQTWSLMPEGLEEGLTPQGMADLLEYVFAATPR
jgi:putative membrane-bound dehydrogenase-like protein